jgi:hypothetical protein
MKGREKKREKQCEHASMLMGILSRLAAVDDKIWEPHEKCSPTTVRTKQNVDRYALHT